MIRVAVARNVLRWALDRSELSEDDLQHKFPKIRQWFTGDSQPTLRQLESLAKATHTPPGFFFLEQPPEDRLPIPYFRTSGQTSLRRTSPDLLETIQIMQRRQFWMHDFLIEQGQDQLPYVKSALPDETPETAANRIRHTLGFDEEWAAGKRTWTEALGALREAIEDAGILVVVNGIVGNNTHRKLDPEEFRGFVLVDEYAPLVFVNGADGKAAQMFTLAHELAHVFFGSSAAFDLREMQPANEPTEQICNRAAAEFLIPERELHRIWDSIKDSPEPFQVIARHFKVSAIVAARRSLDTKIINKNTFLEFYRDYLSDERRAANQRSKGGDFYATQNLRIGQRFASTLIRAVKEGKVLYSEAYRLTGLHGKTFDQYAASLGFGGA